MRKFERLIPLQAPDVAKGLISEPTMDDFQQLAILGAGTFATVFKVKDKRTN